jgi:hypothetical protein
VSAAEANARTLRLQRRPRLDFEATGGRDPLSLVVLSWPAFDASLTAAEQGAVAARIGAEATLQDVELTIAEQRRQADVDFASTGRRIVQSRTQVTLATELVGIYFEQFRVGRRNLLDLLAAYAELSNGEAALVAAQVDQALARYRIAYTTAPFAPRFENTFAALPDVPMPEPASVPPFRSAAAPSSAPALQPPAPSRPAEPAPPPDDPPWRGGLPPGPNVGTQLAALRRAQARRTAGLPVDDSELQPGDLVFFDTLGQGKVSHVGIYLGDDRFVNANSYHNKVVVDRLKSDKYWAPRYLGARRVMMDLTANR